MRDHDHKKKKKWFFLLKQPSTANGFSANWGPLVFPPTSILNFLTGFIFCRPFAGNKSYREFTGTASLPCPEDSVSQHFSASYGSHSFSEPSSEVFFKHQGLNIQHHFFLNILSSFESLYCCHWRAGGRPLWPELRRAQIYGYEYKYLEDSSTAKPFSKARVDSALGPMISPVMRFWSGLHPFLEQSSKPTRKQLATLKIVMILLHPWTRVDWQVSIVA